MLYLFVQWPVWPFSARSSIYHIASPLSSLQTCLSQLCELRFSFIFLSGLSQILNQYVPLTSPLISYQSSPPSCSNFLHSLMFQYDTGFTHVLWQKKNKGPDALCRDTQKYRISVFQMGTTVSFTCRSQHLDTVPPTLSALKAMNELKWTMSNFTQKPPGMHISTGLSFWIHLPFENTS